jgi:hypothetical protein
MVQRNKELEENFDGGDIADLMATFFYELPQWGGWKLGNNCCVEYLDEKYGFDLRGFTTSAKMLDMIMQVARKLWATDECTAGLVRALEDILNPQAHLCSCGGSKRLAVKKIEQMCKGYKRPETA